MIGVVAALFAFKNGATAPFGLITWFSAILRMSPATSEHGAKVVEALATGVVPVVADFEGWPIERSRQGLSEEQEPKLLGTTA